MSHEFRFFLTDGVNTVPIEEPIGWADATESLTRSEEYQGFFSTIQIGELEYYGIAYQILLEIFSKEGVDSFVVLIVEVNCGGQWQEYYRGILDFLTFTITCDCIIRISHDQQSDEKAFLTRRDQPVDLESLQAFDGETLTPYFALGTKIDMPSKGIFLQSAANDTNGIEYLIGQIDGGNNFTGDPDWPVQDQSQTGLTQGYIFPQYQNVSFAEIGIFQPGTADFIVSSDLNNSTFLAVLDSRQDGCSYQDFRMKLQLKGYIYDQSGASRTSSYNLLFIKKPFNSGTNVAFRAPINIPLSSTSGGTNLYDFDIGLDELITVNDGDILWIAIFIQYNRTTNGVMNLRYWQTDECFIKFEALTKCPSTSAKVFLINETFSRIAEAYTEGKVRALSNYFGRLDSEPYNQETDGCGGLEVVTNGLFVRGVEKTRTSKPTQFTASFLDIMNGMIPIHNIGAGIENDPFRSGFKCLRIEPYKYFYQDTVIFEALDAREITVEVIQEKAHGIVNVGYSKWEAEALNGLDEFLTNRKYRTTLKNNNLETSAVNAISSLVASGYAIEITRRKGNTDSQDWRYDNDRFVICVERYERGVSFFEDDLIVINDSVADLYQPGDTVCFSFIGDNAGCFTVVSSTQITGNAVALVVAETITIPESAPNVQISSNRLRFGAEIGGITNPLNIIDPDSVYNYRITPYRNLLRWTHRIMECYQSLNNKRLIFAEGQGNYYASGLLDDDCALELSEVAENQDVDVTVFKDHEDAVPIMNILKLSFEYPVTQAERDYIAANPYGLIRVTSDNCDFQGWLISMTRIVKTGLTQFVLRLKDDSNDICCDYSVDGIFLTTGFTLCFQDEYVWDLETGTPYDMFVGNVSGFDFDIPIQIIGVYNEDENIYTVTAKNIIDWANSNDFGENIFVITDENCLTVLSSFENGVLFYPFISWEYSNSSVALEDLYTITAWYGVGNIVQLRPSEEYPNQLSYSYDSQDAPLPFSFQVNINGVWTDVTDEVENGTWTRTSCEDNITEWRIIDSDENVVDSGLVNVTC